MSESTLISSGGKLTREELALVPTPPGTATHRPIPHIEVIQALIETLGFRHIGVVKEEYAVDKAGMKMFGVLDLDTGMQGCRFSIGIRNAHDKSMRLAMTVGYRVFVCENMAFSGDFQPVLAKHSKNFSLVHAVSIGVDEMQRNFDGMRMQVEEWRQAQLSDTAAKLIINRAFIESDLEVPNRLARPVHDLYFNPQHDEFQQFHPEEKQIREMELKQKRERLEADQEERENRRLRQRELEELTHERERLRLQREIAELKTPAPAAEPKRSREEQRAAKKQQIEAEMQRVSSELDGRIAHAASEDEKRQYQNIKDNKLRQLRDEWEELI